MSWYHSQDGTVMDLDGDGCAPITEEDLRAVDFDRVGGYRPTIGGLRHLTDQPCKPPDRTVVPLLCGPTYEVGSRPKSPHVYDCSSCAEVQVERTRMSPRRARAAPLPTRLPGSTDAATTRGDAYDGTTDEDVPGVPRLRPGTQPEGPV